MSLRRGRCTHCYKGVYSYQPHYSVDGRLRHVNCYHKSDYERAFEFGKPVPAKPSYRINDNGGVSFLPQTTDSPEDQDGEG